MFSFEQEPLLVEDREDLIAVLKMRFQEVPPAVIEDIYDIHDANVLQRLILVAANARNWEVFMEELQSGEKGGKIVGERYFPF